MAVVDFEQRPTLTFSLLRREISVGEKETEQRKLLQLIAKDTWGSLQKMSETKQGVVNNKIWLDSGDKLGRKTSPADIGLSMSAALAMRDLREISNVKFEEYIDTSLSFLERTPDRGKCGLYYNWYDTETGQIAHLDQQTGKPLPSHLPAVDNSILAMSLIVMRNSSIHSQRAQRILQGMNFPYLYDHSENLFHGVGNDDGNKLSNYYLDMLTSESRLTTYIGINEFPKSIPTENYQRLGRLGFAPKEGQNIRANSNSNGGHWKTWGGTLFEVTLPTIFVPEMEWGPQSFGKQYRQYVDRAIKYGKETGLGIWTDPCDDFTGNFRNYGCSKLGCAQEFGCEEYIQDGTETPSAMFSALSISPTKAITAIVNLYNSYPEAYNEGYGFRDSIRINDEKGIAPTCLSFNQARTILHIFNAIDQEGGIYKYTRSQLDKIRPLIENEPATIL